MMRQQGFFRRYFEAISSIAEKREELVDDLVNCAENFERVVEDKTNGSARGDFGCQSSLYQCISELAELLSVLKNVYDDS